MCDLILVTLSKIWSYYSYSSRENATPSNGTSPLASYKEVPSPGLRPRLRLTFVAFCILSVIRKQ